MDLKFTDLQQAVMTISESKTLPEKIASLAKAFDLFSQESRRLENAYSTLRDQFKTVNYKLEESNNQLNMKVKELDVTTYYLNSILSHISQGLLFLDLNGNITTYNTAAKVILQKEPDAVLFSSFWDNFPDNAFGFSMREVLSKRKSPKTSYATFPLEDGSYRELESDASFVLSDRTSEDLHIQSMQGLIVLIRDITDLRTLQTIANRNDRMKELGEMAAMVAHEIRNPLGGIKGFASLLDRDLKDKPELHQMAAYIIEGTDNLNTLVTDVLNFSRPIHLHLEPTDLIALAQELQQHIIADHTYSQKITVEVVSRAKNLIVPMDHALFKSALLNLLVNAVQAMPQGGKITMAIKEENSYVIIKVSDTGTGISPENMNKLFSPLFTTKEKGNGFGLAEVHKVVLAHGGTIDVDSKVGKGTTFTIKHPLKPEVTYVH